MTTELAFAVVLGTAFGLGVCLTVSVAPRWGAPGLARRVAPYIRDVIDPRGLSPSVRTERGLREAWTVVLARVARVAGGEASVTRRLQQAGWASDATAFRGRQLAWTVAGMLAGAVLVVVLVVIGRGTTAMWLLPPVLGLVAVVVCDLHLSRAARARVSRIEEELPTVLEFLALCLSAGEGMLDSLRRIGDVGAGDLTAELRATVLEVGTGSPLSEALSRLARRLDVQSLTRSTDHIVAALERGAPLAQVLHAQALDAREDAKRLLLEQAGRKEIYMLLPLVFLILPLSVLFAVFPGILMLRLGIG